MSTRQLKAASNERQTTIEEFAAAWEVSPKAVQNWCEFIYQAFEIVLPSSGPFPEWSMQLLSLAAKHISSKASLYFSETGEKRRLKGSEFVNKVRRMRLEGHFQEFQKFRNFQDSPELADAVDLEDELLAEVGQFTREGDQRLHQLKAAIAKREDQQVEELAQYVEGSDHRMLGKLTKRLQAGKLLNGVPDGKARADDAIDIAFERLQ